MEKSTEAKKEIKIKRVRFAATEGGIYKNGNDHIRKRQLGSAEANNYLMEIRSCIRESKRVPKVIFTFHKNAKLSKSIRELCLCLLQKREITSQNWVAIKNTLLSEYTARREENQLYYEENELIDKITELHDSFSEKAQLKKETQAIKKETQALREKAAELEKEIAEQSMGVNKNKKRKRSSLLTQPQFFKNEVISAEQYYSTRKSTNSSRSSENKVTEPPRKKLKNKLDFSNLKVNCFSS